MTSLEVPGIWLASWNLSVIRSRAKGGRPCRAMRSRWWLRSVGFTAALAALAGGLDRLSLHPGRAESCVTPGPWSSMVHLANLDFSGFYHDLIRPVGSVYSINADGRCLPNSLATYSMFLELLYKTFHPIKSNFTFPPLEKGMSRSSSSAALWARVQRCIWPAGAAPELRRVGKAAGEVCQAPLSTTGKMRPCWMHGSICIINDAIIIIIYHMLI